VNGPISGVFGESRPGHLHTGLDIAVPRARRSAPPTPGASCSCRASAPRVGTATSRASSTTPRPRRATRTSRGSARRWARTSARARSSATSATPGIPSARTCTSRSA
jgi:hypothetical protein